jgi:hypothetical protein
MGGGRYDFLRRLGWGFMYLLWVACVRWRRPGGRVPIGLPDDQTKNASPNRIRQ